MTDRTDDRRAGGSSGSGSASDSGNPADTDDASGETARSPKRASESAPGPKPTENGRQTGILGWLRWFRTVDSGPMLYARDLLTSVLIVLFIGASLFAISGVWPPMVAVESGSMEPNLERGDLVFLVENERFTPDAAVTTDGHSTGVVPADIARTEERRQFGRYGDVIVFQPNGNTGRTPVIHRAMLWVEADENWYDRADPDAVGRADDCTELDHCPAPHAGFITKGDNERTNTNYDQVTRLSAPVRPRWIVGTAELHIPYLGHLRLILATVSAAETPGTAAGTSSDATVAYNRTAA